MSQRHPFLLCDGSRGANNNNSLIAFFKVLVNAIEGNSYLGMIEEFDEIHQGAIFGCFMST